MKQISIEIIHKCPNKCLHCSSCSDITRTMKLSTDKICSIIDSAKELNTEIISISGGEPFLHEGLVEIVQYAKMQGIKVYIYTSGITSEHTGEVCSINFETLKLIKDADVDKIIFDLPAINEQVYDEFMGTSGYQGYALESIHLCRRLDIFTEIHFVPTKINVGQIDDLLAFAEKEGINAVSFLGLIPHGRAKEFKNRLYLDTWENEQLKCKLHMLESEEIRVGIPLQYVNSEYKCYAGRSKLCIRYDGKVFGCEAFKYVQLCDDNGDVVSPDSIYEKDLVDIYYNSVYLRMERKFVEKQMCDCNCQEKCPVQRMMRKAVGF